ncbi:MAG TPA: hypothetical protein VJG32_10050 [Anaerolineae bacterium]|nr:hypothetical protein [Anaerolineae bacterium]
MKYEFEDVRDTLNPALKAKIERGEPLTPEEVLAVKLTLDLGDTCGCDDTHHRKSFALVVEEGAKRANFSD